MKINGSNLKIVHRLGMGFGLMSLVLLIVCSVAAVNSLNVRTLSERELGMAQEDQSLSTTMLSELQRQDIAIRNAGLDSDPDRMQSQARAARAAAKRADAAVDALLRNPRSTQEVAMLEELRKLNKEAYGISERALALALAFQPEEAVTMINGKLQPISVKRADLLASFEKDKRAAVERAVADIGALSARALIVILVAGAAGLLVAVACAWVVSRSISRPMQSLVDAANRLAGGDLTVQFPGEGSNEMAVLSAALRTMSQDLREVIGTMRLSAQEIHTASTEIATGNRDLSERTELQAASLQETVSSVAELTGAVQRNAESASTARGLATQAATVAGEGGKRVGEVATTMNDIAKSSQRISEIVSVIDDIAFQTNILALNAAVEAARAGEHGRGFAVVASEVRGLSHRSAMAAKEIRDLIDANAQKVDGGSRLVGAAAATMGEIVLSSSKVAQIVAEISNVSSTQASSLNTASASISTIDDMTQQNAALVEQAAAAAISLAQQTRTLNDTVGRFRTETAAGAPGLAPSLAVSATRTRRPTAIFPSAPPLEKL